MRLIPSNIIQLLLDTFKKANSPNNTINIKNFNKSTHYKATTDGSIANIVGYYYDDDKDEIIVIFYGREKKANGKHKSFLDPIPLKKVSEFYKEIENSNINNIENFSLIKSVSGKSPVIERDGLKYKYIRKSGKNNPIIFTKLEKNKDGSYKLSNELRPANKNNIKKNNIKKNNSEPVSV